MQPCEGCGEPIPFRGDREYHLCDECSADLGYWLQECANWSAMDEELYEAND